MTDVYFNGQVAPTPERLKADFMETTSAMLVTETTGDFIEERRQAEVLLDLYIDLGYLSTSSVLELVPAQGYEQIESD